MAKKAVILEQSDYDRIVEDLLAAKSVLGRMRNSHNRNTVEYYLDLVLERLTQEDDIERRLSSVERLI